MGIDPTEYSEEPRTRQLLRFLDSLSSGDGQPPLARKPSGYLASDLFGPIIYNLPLSEWTRMAVTAGLHLQGSLWASHTLRRAVEDPGLASLLMPRSRAEVCQLLETVLPARFHHLLFTAMPGPQVPWQDHRRLISCRSVWTGLYQCHLPPRSTSKEATQAVTLKSRAINTQLDWSLPEWSIEILRHSRLGGTVAKILSKRPFGPPPKLLREHLYLLHQLAVITMLP